MYEIIKGLEEFYVKGKGEWKNVLKAIELLYHIKEKKRKFYKYLESLENEAKNNSKEEKDDLRILVNGTDYNYNKGVLETIKNIKEFLGV